MLQISTLVEHRSGSTCGSLRATAIARVGQAVNLAVERFVTVGETIADDYHEVKQGMYEACKDARAAGKFIYSLEYLNVNMNIFTYRISSYYILAKIQHDNRILNRRFNNAAFIYVTAS